MSVGLKIIDFSGHATMRMSQRGISTSQVTVTIRSPDRNYPGNTNATKKLEKDFPNGQTLVVITEEAPECIKAVTTYWKT